MATERFFSDVHEIDVSEPTAAAPPSAATRAVDYFVERDGVRFAGMHLLADFWQAEGLDDADHVERALREAAAACDATLLHVHLHAFEPSGGVSGVAVLAESHISIHTWPERAFAALDLFMCGRCNPYDALPALRRAFRPASVQLHESKRGLLP